MFTFVNICFRAYIELTLSLWVSEQPVRQELSIILHFTHKETKTQSVICLKSQKLVAELGIKILNSRMQITCRSQKENPLGCYPYLFLGSSLSFQGPCEKRCERVCSLCLSSLTPGCLWLFNTITILCDDPKLIQLLHLKSREGIHAYDVWEMGTVPRTVGSCPWLRILGATVI